MCAKPSCEQQGRGSLQRSISAKKLEDGQLQDAPHSRCAISRQFRVTRACHIPRDRILRLAEATPPPGGGGRPGTRVWTETLKRTFSGTEHRSIAFKAPEHSSDRSGQSQHSCASPKAAAAKSFGKLCAGRPRWHSLNSARRFYDLLEASKREGPAPASVTFVRTEDLLTKEKTREGRSAASAVSKLRSRLEVMAQKKRLGLNRVAEASSMCPCEKEASRARSQRKRPLRHKGNLLRDP